MVTWCAAANDAYRSVEMSVHCDVVVFSWLLDYVKSSRGPAIAKVRHPPPEYNPVP